MFEIQTFSSAPCRANPGGRQRPYRRLIIFFYVILFLLLLILLLLLLLSSFPSLPFGSSRQDDGMDLGKYADADANTDADANDGWDDTDDGDWGDLEDDDCQSDAINRQANADYEKWHGPLGIYRRWENAHNELMAQRAKTLSKSELEMKDDIKAHFILKIYTSILCNIQF
jgi:hypothetical protein